MFLRSVISVTYRLTMDKSLGTLLHFWGIFQFTQTQPLPSPTNKDGRVYLEFFFRVSTLYTVGEGELQENFKKDAPFFMREHRIEREKRNTALLSQGRLSMIVPYSRYKFSSSSLKLPVTFPDLELNISRPRSLRKKGA